ncbi:MAG: biotin/lipoyl-binding protein [Bryobacterales bacterium]|nr:biotin/lipoyl-binding protein [Bryobacterales bacterium]MDE0624527.1 biotin/lipoyl-binding protein [Bryobacterales bacterium]
MKKVDLVVDGTPWSLRIGPDSCEIDGRRSETNIRCIGRDSYSVIVDGSQHTVVVNRSAQGSYEAHVAGTALAVEIRDPRRLSGDMAGLAAGGSQAVRTPMPGKVLSVRVQVGDEVRSDQGLLVVEAMKMQNELRSPCAGRVAAVHVSAGDSVSAGDTLVVVE